MPIRLPVILSPSRTEQSARCHRRHMLGDVCDRRSFSSPSADFGSVIHTGIGLWWTSRNNSSRTSIVNTAIENTWRDLRPTGDKHSLNMAKAMMEGYMQEMPIAGPLPGTWTPVQVRSEWEELLFEPNGGEMIETRIVIPNGEHFLSFQIDRLLTNGKNDYAMIDTKTSARLTQRWDDGWKLNTQMMTYRAALRELLPDARNIFLLIEGLEKKAKFTHRYVMLPEWTDSQLDEALEKHRREGERDREVLIEAWHGTSAIVDDNELNETEFNQIWRAETEKLAVLADFNYADCFAYFLECPYRKLCLAPPEQRWAMLQEYKIVEIEGY